MTHRQLEEQQLSGSVPPDRCGYVTSYNEPWQTGKSCCVREIESGEDRCIWHSDIRNRHSEDLIEIRTEPGEIIDQVSLVGLDSNAGVSFSGWYLRGADLSSANLSGVDLTSADLRGADLTSANLRGADLTDADLVGATLSSANLRNADLTGADLRMADLTRTVLFEADLEGANFQWGNLTEAVLDDATASDADFTDADLSDAQLHGTTARNAAFVRANLSRANLFDAEFREARLYGAVLADAQVNKETSFGGYYRSEDAVDEEDTTSTERARWVYRQLEQLARQNALQDEADEYYVTRKDIQRREYFEGPGLGNKYCWLKATTAYLVSGYGNNPRRVVGFSVLTILAFSLVFSFLGGVQFHTPQNSEVFAFSSTSFIELTLPDWVEILLKNAYFSMVTFTTLGYGDLRPTTFTVQLLAGLESLFGTLLMALLIFVLGRRTTR